MNLDSTGKTSKEGRKEGSKQAKSPPTTAEVLTQSWKRKKKKPNLQ
jgi:hypothetical protein